MSGKKKKQRHRGNPSLPDSLDPEASNLQVVIETPKAAATNMRSTKQECLR
jgi:hypothetical protein